MSNEIDVKGRHVLTLLNWGLGFHSCADTTVTEHTITTVRIVTMVKHFKALERKEAI